MTVYMYDSDTQGSGTSTCTGGCLSAWPPVPGDATLIGATGEVTTITGTDGNPQLALNGWPLYYYASDSVAGDETGQGVGGVWWVLDASGEPVRN
jgi:predicted lipoprotein with Yx(FWY)xxD motif